MTQAFIRGLCAALLNIYEVTSLTRQESVKFTQDNKRLIYRKKN